MTRVAFIGLGTMGGPMARNLVQGGHPVVGFDLDAAALERHAANGGATAPSAAEAAREAEVTFTMLPDAPHVRAALLGPDGAAETFAPEGLIVDMSTVHPLESDRFRDELGSRGLAMVDAPVGRTSQAAERGELLIMAGGAPEEIARLRPLFDLLGDTVIDCGGPGKGIRMKLVNNFMSIALNALSAEALTLAEAIGLDVDLAIRVMAGTAAGRGHLTTTYPAKALRGDVTPAFMLDLADKDLGLALDLAARSGVPAPLGGAARSVYTLARARGRGKEDWTALYLMVRELAGVGE